MLTLADIVRKADINRSALNRYLAEADVRRILGGEHTHPEYPETSLPMFCRLAELHRTGEAKPKTLAAQLRTEARDLSEIRIPDTDRNSDTPLVRNPNTEQNLMVMPQQAVAFLDQIADAVAHRISAELSPPPEDRLITSIEAADLIACKPRAVGRYVRHIEGRKGIYKRSDVLRYIQAA